MTKLLLLAALLLPAVASAAPTDDAITAMQRADQAQMVLEINAEDPSRASSDLGAQATKLATECNDAVDKALAAGSTASTILLVDGYRKVALGTVKPEHCAKLADFAKQLDAKIAAARADRDAAITGPLKAAGLGGEKLAWAVRWTKNEYDFYGAGGKILKPAQLAGAKVIFLVTGDADHVWVLHRYAFAGNKLTGSTEQQFLVRPAPSKFR